MSGAKHHRKGDRIERELVELHQALGVHAERYPLSGASRFRGSGHDLDVYVRGREEAPIVAEVKARKDGNGFTTLAGWASTMYCSCAAIMPIRWSLFPGAYGRPCLIGGKISKACCHGGRPLVAAKKLRDALVEHFKVENGG
jgi:hypothetical protein